MYYETERCPASDPTLVPKATSAIRGLASAERCGWLGAAEGRRPLGAAGPTSHAAFRP